MSTGSPLLVVAGALVDGHGRVLVAQRPAGKAMAGRWEFPGGKRLPHETPRDTLNRELLEELGIQVARARPLLAVTHRYAPDAPPVHIDCWRVEAWRGEIRALDAQAFRWCEREELVETDILEADAPIVTALRLPEVFVRVDDPDGLAERVPGAGARPRARVAWLVERPPADPGVARRLREAGDSLFVLDPHAPPSGGFGRVYSRPSPFVRDGRSIEGRAELVGRIVHDAGEARAARGGGADFLLVPDRDLEATELAALAAVGLPFYVNVAAPARDPSAPPATGKLWWKSELPIARL